MSVGAGLAIAVTAGILGGQAFFALMGADAWPFTSYPMFSVNLSVDEVVIYRAQLVDRYGRPSWWTPRHGKDKEQLSFQFARILHDCSSYDEFRRPALALITKFVVQDLESVCQCRSEDLPARIRIVRRSIEFRAGRPTIRETEAYQVTLSARPRSKSA